MKKLAVLFAVVIFCGCADPVAEPLAEAEPNEPANRPGGMLNLGKTDKIGEFDPAGGRQVSDSAVTISNPLTGALEAYGPLVEQISKMGIHQAVEMFRATNGRYPKDHDEFMQKVIREGGIRLPKLPGGAEYQYDVENHKLVVVEKKQGQ